MIFFCVGTRSQESLRLWQHRLSERITLRHSPTTAAPGHRDFTGTLGSDQAGALPKQRTCTRQSRDTPEEVSERKPQGQGKEWEGQGGIHREWCRGRHNIYTWICMTWPGQWRFNCTIHGTCLKKNGLMLKFIWVKYHKYCSCLVNVFLSGMLWNLSCRVTYVSGLSVHLPGSACPCQDDKAWSTPDESQNEGNRWYWRGKGTEGKRQRQRERSRSRTGWPR